MEWVKIIVTIVAAAFFVSAGYPKVTSQQKMVDAAEHLQLSTKVFQLVGALELLGAVGLIVGLFVPFIGVISAIGFVLLMVGAVCFHLRAKDDVKTLAPSLGGGVASIVVLILMSAV